VTTNRGTLNAATLVPGLREIFFNEYGQWPQEFPLFLNVETSKRAFEEKMLVAAFGLTQIKPEGQGVAYDDLADRAPIRLTHVARALGFRATREAMDDELYGVINSAPSALQRSVHQTKEIIGASVLNNAFSSSFTGLDGKALSATDHPLLGGGTFSNKLTADLTPTGLRAALIAAEKYVDEKGMNIMIKMKHLAVPVDLMFRAREILGSTNKPFVNDNELNVLRDVGLSSLVLHFLSSTTAWYLLADKKDHKLQYFERVLPKFEGADDFDTGDAKFKTYHRDSAGFWNHYGVIASDGTGT
jgi:hypothetical protein